MASQYFYNVKEKTYTDTVIEGGGKYAPQFKRQFTKLLITRDGFQSKSVYDGQELHYQLHKDHYLVTKGMAGGLAAAYLLSLEAKRWAVLADCLQSPQPVKSGDSWNVDGVRLLDSLGLALRLGPVASEAKLVSTAIKDGRHHGVIQVNSKATLLRIGPWDRIDPPVPLTVSINLDGVLDGSSTACVLTTVMKMEGKAKAQGEGPLIERDFNAEMTIREERSAEQ
jgi:hypothetical protein